MAKWIRKVKQDLTNFRISIPTCLVSELGWESCRFVIVQRVQSDKILIERCPGDRSRFGESTADSFEQD